jgi:hypothetical protein
VSANCGTRSPMATRKKALGKTAEARTKASRRPTPPKSDEMWLRDAIPHHMTFATGLFRSQTGYPSYSSKV